MPAILFAVFIDLVGFGLIVPILPFLVLGEGGSTITGTLLVSIFSLMAFLSGPLWGRLSDRIGRRPALAIIFFGAMLSYLLLAFSTSLTMVFIARACSGTFAGNIGIVTAAIADMTTSQNRGKAMGYFGAVFGLGFAVGPGIGGVLGGLHGSSPIFYPGLMAAALSLTAMILTLIFVRETNPNADTSAKKTRAQAGTSRSVAVTPASSAVNAHPAASTPQTSLEGAKAATSTDAPIIQRRGWRSLIAQSGGAGLFLMFIVTSVSQSITFSIMPFWADAALQWNENQVGILMMSAGLGVACIQIFAVGPLFRIFGEVKSLILGLATQCLGLVFLFGLPASPLAAFLSFPFLMCGLTISFPGLNSIVSFKTDAKHQGAALGLANGLASLGRVMGPITAGFFFSAANPNGPFVIVMLLGAILLVWAMRELAHNKPAPGSAPTNPA